MSIGTTSHLENRLVEGTRQLALCQAQRSHQPKAARLGCGSRREEALASSCLPQRIRASSRRLPRMDALANCLPGVVVLLLLSRLILLSPTSAIAQPMVTTTIAGSVSTSGANDGSGLAAQFSDPTGLAMDANGNLYLADNQNHTIRKLAPDATVSTLAGQSGVAGSADGTGTNALFSNPSGLVVDGTGNIYVTDTGNHTLRRISPGGAVVTLAGMAGESGPTNGPGNLARFNSPLGIALDKSGVLYVADSGNHAIREVTPAGMVTTLAGLLENWGSTDGTGGGALFNSPTGVAVDSAGNVFVSDSNNHTISKITPAGVVTTWAGLAGADGGADGTGAEARFEKPAELKVDRGDNLFVVDSFNHAIRRITTNAVVSTIAGLAGSGGSGDGLGSQARFLNPYGLAVDRNGNLRVSDTYNQTVRFLHAPIAAVLGQAVGSGFPVISWAAVSGNTYQVQFQDSPAGSWQNLGGVVTVSGTSASLTDDSVPQAPQRFYRVLLAP